VLKIENSAELFGVSISDVLIRLVFQNFLGPDFEAGIEALIECLLEAGIIVELELPPPPDSISDNGIAGMNVECTGDPLCEFITGTNDKF
jgi:hypothetical protein